MVTGFFIKSTYSFTRLPVPPLTLRLFTRSRLPFLGFRPGKLRQCLSCPFARSPNEIVRMLNPQRVLKKILRPDADLAAFESSGEALEATVDLFRNVQKCCKARAWLLESAGFDAALSPQAFTDLLALPEIDRLETVTRDLDVEISRRSDARRADDPVSVGELNAALRELYKDLDETRSRWIKDCDSRLYLLGDISDDSLKRAEALAGAMKNLSWQGFGFVVSIWKARGLEADFKKLFPQADGVHPLRQSLPRVEKELEFYAHCRRVNEKWRPLGVDLTAWLRGNLLSGVAQNLEELGNAIWNLVYESPRLPKSVQLAELDFNDVETLFNNKRINP